MAMIVVPELDCPFDDEISAYADQVDTRVVDWARRLGLPADEAEAERLGEAKVGRLAARTTPRAGLDALCLLADWQMWLFLFDDRYSDESAAGADLAQLSELVTGFMLVLDNHGDRRYRQDPFTVALGDLIDRVRVIATGPQLSRFVSAVRGYFLAQFWEASHRAQDQPAGLAEYTAMRRHSGAVPTCMALIDVANGFELSGHDYWRPEVRAVSDIAVNVTCWANDILSFPKEAQRSFKVHSLPAVLAEELQLPVTDALALAAELHDAEVERYLNFERLLRLVAGPALGDYLDGLRSWMGGNFYWSLETGRYKVAVGSACAAGC